MTARHDTEARLEPCPFCGEPVRLVKSAIGCDWIEHVPRAGMPECGMEFSAFNLLGDLVGAWNTRALGERADVVEECAKIAERHLLSQTLPNATDCWQAYNHAAREIATAIRAHLTESPKP